MFLKIEWKKKFGKIDWHKTERAKNIFLKNRRKEILIRKKFGKIDWHKTDEANFFFFSKKMAHILPTGDLQKRIQQLVDREGAGIKARHASLGFGKWLTQGKAQRTGAYVRKIRQLQRIHVPIGQDFRINRNIP